MTDSNLFAQATPTGTINSGAGNNGTNGIHFTVSQSAVLDGVWHWSSSSDTQLPTSIGLYTTQATPASGTLVTSNTATWLTGPGGSSASAGSGWCFAAFTSPPALAAGTNYMATQFRNDAVNRWFSFYSVTWPVTSGILTAPKDQSTSALSQGWYNIGTAMAMPLTQTSTAGDNFGMDVQVTPTGAASLSGSGAITAGGTITGPYLVQSKSATGGASSPITVTMNSNVTAGNCLIVCFTSSASPTNPSITGVTLGGAADNFASVLSVGSTSTDTLVTQMWADPNCAGGSAAVAVSFSPAATSVDIIVMEWAGLASSSILDKSASQINNVGASSWSSTATATTTQASEIAIGAVGAFNGTAIGTITGPGSPWTNLAQQTSASTHVGLLVGYQGLTSTGTVTYSGTTGVTAEYTAAVATFKAKVPHAGAASLSGSGAIRATGGIQGKPSLVQSVTGNGAASPVSITLPWTTTSGNCLIVCVTGDAGTNNPNVTGITLGGSADNFAQSLTAGNVSSDFMTTAIWADPNCAGGQTALSITFTSSGTGAALMVTVMEWFGLSNTTVPDKTSSGISDTTVTSWSSGATAATTQASEVAIGAVGAFASPSIGTISGPSSPWFNLAQQNSPGGVMGLVAGYQVLTSTGAVTYSGTQTTAADYTAVAATFKATVIHSGAAAMSGSGAITAAGQKNVPGAAALTGSGTITASGVFAGSAALSGSGTFTANGQKTVPGAAAMSGSGTFTAAGVFAGSAALTGSGTIAATGQKQVPGASSMSGIGTFTGSFAIFAFGTAALSGSGSFTATGQKNVPGASAMSGSGTLTASGVLAGSAALSGSGTITAAGQKQVPGAAAMSGSGTVTAPPTVIVPAASSVSGSGTFTATGQKLVPGASAMSGSGVITSTGQKNVPGAAPLEGQGAIGATGQKTVPAAAAMSGSGSLTAPPTIIIPAGTAVLSGSGTFTAAGQKTVPGAATMDGSGSITAVEGGFVSGTSAMSGSGTFTAAGQKLVPGATALDGSGTVTAAPLVAFSRTIALDGSGTLSGQALVLVPAAAALSGSGTAAGTGQKLVPGTAALSGSGTIGGAALVIVPGVAALSGSGTLAAGFILTFAGSAPLSGSGTFTTAARKLVPGVVAFSGSGTLAAPPVHVWAGSAGISAPGSLAAAAVIGHAGRASLSGSGALAATSRKNISPGASLSGIGTFGGTGTVVKNPLTHLSGSGTIFAGHVRTVPGTAAMSGSGALHPAGHRVLHFTAGMAAAATLHAQATRGKNGLAHLAAPGTMTAAGDIPVQGAASLHASPVLYATAFTRFGQAALSGTPLLSASAAAGPDLEALWSSYLALKVIADQKLSSYKMMRQAGGTDGSAGFLYAEAYDAERDADLAYTAFQEAQRRVFAGAPG